MKQMFAKVKGQIAGDMLSIGAGVLVASLLQISGLV